MTDGPSPAKWIGPQARLVRLLILLGGIFIGQFILYGPSLVGRKILLPLDILAAPGMYLPRTPEVRKIETQNTTLSDLVEVEEPARRFGHEEFHALRLPLWTPYNFAGAPFTRSNFSPFFIFQCLFASRAVIAWSQMFAAIIAGVGAYSFCRRVLSVGFWPATIAGWCYPLTGFFILWQGYPTSLPVIWLPWVLLAVDKTARRINPFAPLALSVVTCLVLISGQLDVAAQVMLASGLYALWTLFDLHGRQWLSRPMAKAIGGVVAGWLLGFLLAAPYLLPVLDYAHSGARLSRRGSGEEERPPIGLKALPQTVLPYMYGTRQTGSLRLSDDNEIESSATAYAGVVATLLLVPLAWCSVRHRRVNLFFVLLAFVSLSWCLNVPGYVELLRLPGLNMMSHNRFVFAASFAFVAMMAIGLEVLREGGLRWRWWLWLSGGVLITTFGWCVYRAVMPPQPVASQLLEAVRNGYQLRWITTVDDVLRVKAWYAQYYAITALLCGLGAAGWWLIRRDATHPARLFPFLATVLVADLLWFGSGRNPQCDPSLYFPPIPALDAIGHATPGRIIGDDCLPAAMASMRGLHDLRGYDGVDPAQLVELSPLFTSTNSKSYSYGLMRRLTPKYTLGANGGLQLSPVLDLLNVRYFVGRGEAPTNSRPAFVSEDYWVLVNSNALPRVFVPERNEIVSDGKKRLEKLGAADFDPRKVAYLETPVQTTIELPPVCLGVADIVAENATRIVVSLHMNTPGLVVLADLWDKGWQAALNGVPVPILRVNHALRGVVAPAGTGTLEFRYEPRSFKMGTRLALLATIVLFCWLAVAWRQSPKIKKL